MTCGFTEQSFLKMSKIKDKKSLEMDINGGTIL